MRFLMIATFGLGLIAASNSAQAIGCVSGAVLGGAAGHVVHHTVTGMVGGCIAGHEAHKVAKRRRLEHQMAPQPVPVQPTH